MTDDAVPGRLTIDLSTVSSAQELHAVLRRALRFPSWTGRNWDAFNDVVSTMVELPAEVTFTGWARISALLPRDARILREILDDYETRHAGKPGWESHFRYVD